MFTFVKVTKQDIGFHFEGHKTNNVDEIYCFLLNPNFFLISVADVKEHHIPELEEFLVQNF